MRAIFRFEPRGFTLIELMIVVAIVGVLAALAVYGVRRYLLSSKTAEARNSLGQLAKDAKTAYERESMSATVLAAQGTAAGSNSLCKSAVNGVPDSMAKISGRKYQSAPTDWTSGDQAAGWQCLKFSMSDPQYYMYRYAGFPNWFTAIANGDLNGDGTSSTFVVYGSVVSGSVFVSPNIGEIAPEE